MAKRHDVNTYYTPNYVSFDTVLTPNKLGTLN